MIEAYPLQWPQGWKRATFRIGSNFKAAESFARVRDGLLHEIRLMGGSSIVLSTNIPLTRDGLPYAKHAQPQDPGAAVYFQWKGKPMSLACDKWRTVAENIRALQLTVEAMRGINRWGSSELMERSFTGFTALPAPQEEHWWDILLVRRDSPLDVIESNYRSLAKEHHPDRGGSSEKFVKITKAVEQARKEKQQ